MKRIRKGDRVIVTTGRDKGRQGTVIRVLDDEHVVIENVNMVKKHQKPNPQANTPGTFVAVPGPDGACKTTTFYMLVGLPPPDSGQVFRSDDGGESWRIVSYDHVAMGRAHYYSRMAVAPDNEPPTVE